MVHRERLVLLLAALVTVVPDASEADELVIEESIRERLTEREDQNRLEDPFSVELFGHLLTLSGEVEILLEGSDPLPSGDPLVQQDRLLLESQLEAELFFSIGEPLSIFIQGRFATEHDLLSGTRDRISTVFAERGEMWLFSENILGSGLDFEIGRLSFEDDRRWWWDEELDAVRLSGDWGRIDVEAAVSYNLGSIRTSQNVIEPDQDGRLRVLAEISWEIPKDHQIDLFVLYDRDNSRTHRLGESVRPKRLDESDGELLWIGPRALGGFTLGTLGFLGYWLDAAVVVGDEHQISFGDSMGGRSTVEGVQRQEVLGWGIDLGATLFWEVALEPRVTLSYAMGSGDSSPDSGKDRAFRQTGLHGNETGLGGEQRFRHYGLVLDPELSNLRILTASVGISFFESSSLDLVYHYYRLVKPADSLRSARLETRLDGRNRSLGHGLDLILAVEEGARFEFELLGSLFRPSSAFAGRRSGWAYGGLVSVRAAF